MLQVADSSHVLRHEQLQVEDTLSYEKELVAEIDRQVKSLRNKDVSSVKVSWKNHYEGEAT